MKKDAGESPMLIGQRFLMPDFKSAMLQLTCQELK
jgi:hypothetical protein